MDDNDDDEMKDLRRYTSDDEAERRNTRKPLEQVVESHKFNREENGNATSKHKHCENPKEWPLDDHDRFTDLYRCSVEGESTVSSEDEENTSINAYKNKTDSLTKDASAMSSDGEKSVAIATSSPAELQEISLPVSLKIENKMGNNAEVNNNVDEIQPQFKELSLHSPTSKTGVIKNANNECLLPVKCLRLYVEASYIINPSSDPEILSISCEPILESVTPNATVLTRDSTSSGQLGDVSKTISSLSGSPMTYVPPPPIHLARMSCTSSSSSSSLTSAAVLAFQRAATDSSHLLQCISQHRINQLNRKWKNSRLVYRILDCIDRVFVEGTGSPTDVPIVVEPQRPAAKNLDVLPEESTPVSSRKRHPSSEDAEDPVSKRLRSASPIASTSFEDLLGAGVFAKWQNRKYYFAHITDILIDGRMQVVFLDTTIRIVTRDQIITEMELLVGHKIMVTHDSDSEEYYPGIATRVFVEDGLCKYSVATNNGDFDVSVGQVYFTEYQAKLIKQGTLSTPLSNTDVSSASSLHAGCSGIQKNMFDMSETDGSPSKTSVELDTHVTGCDVETNDPQNLNSSVKLKNVQGKLPKRSNKNEDSLLGPLKFKGTWFKGLYFLVTCSTHIAPNSNEEVQTDSEDYPFTTVPFVYDRLVQQIKLGGGQVFDKFEDVDPNRYGNTYLVTNRPCLTPKYLKCLAAGISILCHEWIVNCTIKQKRLTLHELPAGWSVEKCSFTNTFERKTAQPLSGLRIKVAQFTDQNFFKFWSDICNVVGASASKFTGNFENTDVIVAEHGFKDPKLDNAIAFGIPVVSSAWIIQSVIHGEVRPFDGHSSYNHLYEETEDF